MTSLGHNEYKSGSQTYKHEWVMNRSHRLNAVESRNTLRDEVGELVEMNS